MSDPIIGIVWGLLLVALWSWVLWPGLRSEREGKEAMAPDPRVRREVTSFVRGVMMGTFIVIALRAALYMTGIVT